MRDDGSFDRGRLEAQVDVAERRGMREDRARQQEAGRQSARLVAPTANGNMRPWRSRQGAFWLPHQWTLPISLRSSSSARARRRRSAGIRAGRPRRRQDARAHAVPRPPLERQDLSVKRAAATSTICRRRRCQPTSPIFGVARSVGMPFAPIFVSSTTTRARAGWGCTRTRTRARRRSPRAAGGVDLARRYRAFSVRRCDGGTRWNRACRVRRRIRFGGPARLRYHGVANRAGHGSA